MTLVVDSPGARRVGYEELAELYTPKGTESWNPISHKLAVDFATKAIEDAGFEIGKSQFALAKQDCRFFGTFDLKTNVTDETTLTVGIRNSIDKSLSFGLVCGERCLVCTNLCFGADNGIEVFRKHSGKIEDDLYQRIVDGMAGLDAYRQKAELRIRHLGI